MQVPLMNRLSEYTAREVEWLWPGRVPIGKVTLVCGDPGVGKSFICMDMAARVSAGLGWPEEGFGAEGEEIAHASERRATPEHASERRATLEHASERRATGEPGSVLVMSAEDDPFDTLRPRVERGGGDVSRVVLLRGYSQAGYSGEWVMRLDENIGVLEEAMARSGGVRLVVVDPVSAFLGRANSHSNTAVRSVLDRLTEVAAAHRAAMVCVTHVNKAEGVRGAYRVMGSLAFAASPRIVWRVGRLRDGRMGMTALKSNVAGTGGAIAYRLVDGRVEWSRADGAEAAEKGWGRSEPALQEACEWLERMLADGPRRAVEVMREGERAGMGWATVRRAKEVCGVEARREGKGWVWGWWE